MLDCVDVDIEDKTLDRDERTCIMRMVVKSRSSDQMDECKSQKYNRGKTITVKIPSPTKNISVC